MSHAHAYRVQVANPAPKKRRNPESRTAALARIRSVARRASSLRLAGRIQEAVAFDRELDRLVGNAERAGWGDEAFEAEMDGRASGSPARRNPKKRKKTMAKKRKKARSRKSNPKKRSRARSHRNWGKVAAHARRVNPSRRCSRRNPASKKSGGGKGSIVQVLKLAAAGLGSFVAVSVAQTALAPKFGYSANARRAIGAAGVVAGIALATKGKKKDLGAAVAGGAAVATVGMELYQVASKALGPKPTTAGLGAITAEMGAIVEDMSGVRALGPADVGIDGMGEVVPAAPWQYAAPL